MRFAAIADVHGNPLALEAVVADIRAQGIDDIVNLGDMASGPLDARRTVDALMALGATSVRGNHDRYLVEQKPDQMWPSDRVAHAQLDKVQLDWLQSLPVTALFRNSVYLCHATPSDDNVYWLETVMPDGAVRISPIEAIERIAEGIEQSLILCGHSHIPRAVRLRDGRMVVNPGSVGCPGYRDGVPFPHLMETGTPDACYSILERRAGRWQVTFRHVPYDHEAMAALARQNQRPEWASALSTGWVR
jgi:diadenosine tetraphosphatase ApaH/serine/threonine PP2A family protein phosphatase